MIPQQVVQNIPPHLNCQSLRRSRSRPSPSSSTLGGGGGHYQTPGIVPNKSLIQPENPYQQPYLGRSAGLSDSPTSDNASDATLTDSELPISNQNALPLQNGGLLMGGNLDFSTASGKLNSLKRNINSNGKSTTGIGLVNHTHSGNHDNLIDQFVMHTSGGKIYIPQDTPKNSTSDYKTSPSSSPTKKISSSLLYKDSTNMGTLRDGRSISKSDDDDFMYKVKRFCCTCNKSLAIVLIFLLGVSFVVNILFAIGAISLETESAKCCVEGGDRIDDSNLNMRQSSATAGNGTYGRRLDKSPTSTGDVEQELGVDETSLGRKHSTDLHVARSTSSSSSSPVSTSWAWRRRTTTAGRRTGMTTTAWTTAPTVTRPTSTGGAVRGGGSSSGSSSSSGRNRMKRSVVEAVKSNSGGSSSDGSSGSSSSNTSTSSRSAPRSKRDLHLHAAQTGVNEMVTTSTEPITEGVEEVSRDLEQTPVDSHHTLSLEQNGRDFHKISRETGEGMDLRRKTAAAAAAVVVMVVGDEADEDAKPTVEIPIVPRTVDELSISTTDAGRRSSSFSSSSSSTSSGVSPGSRRSYTSRDEGDMDEAEETVQEIAADDDSKRGNIFDHLIEVVSRGRELEQEQQHTPKFVMNVEETARKSGNEIQNLRLQQQQQQQHSSSSPAPPPPPTPPGHSSSELLDRGVRAREGLGSERQEGEPETQNDEGDINHNYEETTQVGNSFQAKSINKIRNGGWSKAESGDSGNQQQHQQFPSSHHHQPRNDPNLDERLMNVLEEPWREDKPTAGDAHELTQADDSFLAGDTGLPRHIPFSYSYSTNKEVSSSAHHHRRPSSPFEQEQRHDDMTVQRKYMAVNNNYNSNNNHRNNRKPPPPPPAAALWNPTVNQKNIRLQSLNYDPQVLVEDDEGTPISFVPAVLGEGAGGIPVPASLFPAHSPISSDSRIAGNSKNGAGSSSSSSGGSIDDRIREPVGEIIKEDDDDDDDDDDGRKKLLAFQRETPTDIQGLSSLPVNNYAAAAAAPASVRENPAADSESLKNRGKAAEDSSVRRISISYDHPQLQLTPHGSSSSSQKTTGERGEATPVEIVSIQLDHRMGYDEQNARRPESPILIPLLADTDGAAGRGEKLWASSSSSFHSSPSTAPTTTPLVPDDLQLSPSEYDENNVIKPQLEKNEYIGVHGRGAGSISGGSSGSSSFNPPSNNKSPPSSSLLIENNQIDDGLHFPPRQTHPHPAPRRQSAFHYFHEGAQGEFQATPPSSPTLEQRGVLFPSPSHNFSGIYPRKYYFDSFLLPSPPPPPPSSSSSSTPSPKSNQTNKPFPENDTNNVLTISASISPIIITNASTTGRVLLLLSSAPSSAPPFESSIFGNNNNSFPLNSSRDGSRILGKRNGSLPTSAASLSPMSPATSVIVTTASTMAIPTETEDDSSWGGVCQCFCPCLETGDYSGSKEDYNNEASTMRGALDTRSSSSSSSSESTDSSGISTGTSSWEGSGLGGELEQKPEDEEFIVIRTEEENKKKKGVRDNKLNFEHITDEWLELSGSGLGASPSPPVTTTSSFDPRSTPSSSGLLDDESFTIPVTDSNSNTFTQENQYHSSLLTRETITMQYEEQDNNSVSEQEIPGPGLSTTTFTSLEDGEKEEGEEEDEETTTEKPIVSYPSPVPNMVDEFTVSSRDSHPSNNLSNERGEDDDDESEDDEEEEEGDYYDDDNETMRPIVQVSTMAEMGSTQGDDYNRENSLVGNPNGIRKEGEGEEGGPGRATTSRYDEMEEHQDETFEWVQCSCSPTQSGKNYYEKVDPGARTYPAVNFPPDSTSFHQITLGSRLSNIIGSYSYWNMQFYQSEGAYVTWEMSVPRGASVGLYARRNALPTHTHYDFMEILRGFKTRSKRSSPPTVTKELSKFIEQGHWFISLYNDDSDPQEVIFASTISEEMTEGCPNGCSGNGQCQMGHCQCNGGFGGEDCSQSICPVLCTGRGEYLNGECQCNPGWKGKECNLRHDECEIPDCNGHGKCVNGKCSCVRGYKGDFCQETDCMHPTCSGHGFCLAGTCMCKKGWRGADCSQPDSEAKQCLPDCSNHGEFNLETQTCTCQPRWTGEDCSQELCDTNCGAHGICIGGGCQCSEGWTGTLCNQRVCDKRCGDHGQCKNGTCLCVTGWNGRHCTLEGCPNSCSGHGQCKANYEGLWECKCHTGWTGIECSVMMEQNCNDGKDNDKDGLTDCEDPECCSVTQCEKSQLCVSARKPIDILLRKQPPAITASFFEKMKFLIEEGSLQSYARQDAFNGSRSGVVRGRVVTPNGSGLMGVRVSSSSPLEPLGGFTLTQDDGWFDLMVNGGGAVTLHFGRSPFNPQTRTIFVPWNEVVIIDIVVMGSLDLDDRVFVRGQSCDSHDYDTMKPIVLATWKHEFQGGETPETSTILVESQVVQESIRIPGSDIHLMYHSSRVQGYLSTIELQLTSETIPTTLKRIHLRITIEGVLFEKIFEADPDIKFTYAWNRLNVYRQRVYGVTTAIVKVGYEYNNCASIIWDVQSTTLSGHDMSISDIGGWSLDIHHRYNFHEGIIQKGDGSNIYLKHRPRVIITTMGNGYQRSLDCLSDCNGVAAKQRLLAPVALQAAPDGTVFVGDFDLIRRIMVDGTVHNVVKLNATRVSYRYHMALSPVDNLLYISDPESHQIIRVRNIEDSSDPEHNWEPVVGSGERCLPGDEAHCGDEALARDAKLAYPKGVAVSSDNVLYFADGTNIRKVDRDGIITTVIGNHQQKSHWKPIPCEGTLKVEEVHLRWPTELTVNPLDNSLYIIDDHMILKLTEDNRIRIIAGRPLHCTVPAGGYEMDLATHATLISPQSMTFASNGDLYVAESDSQRINRVRLVTTDGRISHFAGAESKCNCLDQGCACYEEDYYLAATSKFNTVSAVCMTPDGVLHVSDQGNNRIRSIMASIPQPQSTEARPYEIYSPDTQEIYIFNRFGQHVATKNIVTGETVYTFLYNVNMSNGKLSSVTDSAGNKIQILRDYSSQVKTIENSQAQKFNLKMSRVRMLQEFSTPEGYNLTFDYHGSTGLIKSRQDSSGRSSVYSYDEFGRLTMAISPTGQVVALTFDLSKKGASVRVRRDDNLPEVVLIKGTSIYKRQGKTEEVTSVHPDGSVVRLFPWGQTITTETVPYNVLGDISPILSDSFPIPGKQRTEVAGDLVNRVEWRYVPRKEGRGKNKQVVQIDKKMRINGENILMIEYDRETKSEILFSDDRNPILNVSYDRSSRPAKWTPSLGFAPVELEYDRFGRLIGWKWDDLTEVYEYDRSGRLFKIDYTDGTSLTHTFRDLINLPMKVTTAGGSDYLIEYDASGAFQSLTTPRGHIHNFGISTSIGVYEYSYKAPSSRDMYKIQYNDLGQILAITYPQGSGRVNYVYNKYNKLEAIVAGLRSARFSYQENSGLLKVSDVSQSSFEVKIEYKYHGGIVKEQREKYGSTTGLDNIHLKYQYDGNARVSGVEVEINGKHVQGLAIRKSQNLGMLETVQDLTIYQNINGDNFNRTLIQDTGKLFQKIIEKDRVARVRRMGISLKGVEVFKLDIDYDSRGKIKHRKMTISKSAYADNVVYDADGHVSDVMGSGNWKYVYDENGNTIQIVEQGEKSSLIYDSGDRVIQVGELFRYTYDPRGFLVQRGNEKFQYDDKGLLLHAVKKDVYKVWFFYDHMDRLVSWKDDQGNVTQFLYANPETPHLITHIHFPFWGKNYLLLYDNSDALVGLTSSDGQRYYVATDQNNSPLAVFNGQGNVVKEIHRTPFGKVVRDTNPEFYLPLGFHGGVVDRKTGLVIISGRPYDPTIGQWMIPNWRTLSATLKAPTDIFSYRFAKNDPITPRNVFADSKMTSLKDWLKLYGYDMNKIFGQDYLVPVAVEPTVNRNPHLVPEFVAVAGLDCIAKTVTTGFKTPGFRRGSKLKTERLLAGVNEWDLMSKIAYKRAAFGPGLLISRIENGKTLISTVDNSVIQGVITSVLNGSLSIDFKSSHQNTFYFVKDNPHKLRDDMEELKRLGGLYNISVHDAENGIKELRLSNGDTSVAVRYGTDRDEEFGRLIKHAHRRAIEKAWEEEKMYISMGLDGRRAWTEEEKEQLLSKGQVHGYRPSDLYNVHKFPQLADDPSNVVFQRDSRRKRRKSNKRHHEHSSSGSISSSQTISSPSSL